MTLGEAQRKFTRLTAHLIMFIYVSGYEATYGDAYRDPRVHGNLGEKESYSSANSNHKRRLALDLNLFKDGKFLVTSEDHRKFGEYWEMLDDRCRWGGRYNDGNHYEYIPEGWR